MGRANSRGYQRAFALPTVLIASIVMLTVLLAGLTAASSISAGLKNQYRTQIGRTAAQSGANMAKACIEGNDGVITWTDDQPLRPNTDCEGTATFSCSSTSTNAACYVLKSGNFRTTFRVGVITDEDDTATDIEAEGIVREVRKTSGEVLYQDTTTLKAALNGVGYISPSSKSSIAAGTTHTCATSPSGKAYCWGNNGSGRLGDGSTTQRTFPVAVSQGAIPAGVTLSRIAAGDLHTCALGSNDSAYCWGSNNNGRLGDGTTSQRTTPTAVSQGAIPAGVTLTNILPGGFHTCALGSDSKAYCWGFNTSGAVGDGTTTQRTSPVAVVQGAIPAGVTLTSLTVGNQHACAIGSDSKAYCWGSNTYNQIGDNTTTQRTSPTAVSQGAIPAGVTLTKIDAGSYHTCAIGSNGKAYCWGYGSSCQTGDGICASYAPVPVAVSQGAVPAGVTLTSIDAGATHTCAMGSDDKTYCWGRGAEGQLGDSATSTRTTPVAVSQGTVPAGVTIARISAGESHTCALGSNNNVYCTGGNNNNQLGDSTTTNRTSLITTGAGVIPAGVTLAKISAGSQHTCAIGSDNKGYCWGYSAFGQLGGTGTTTTPVAVSQGAIPAGVTLAKISAGSQHTCAIGSDNKGYCWGSNASRQIGDGASTQRNTPVAVSQGAIPAGVTLTSISAGVNHSCATGSDGKAYCWGGNTNGELGDGTGTQRATPVAVNQGAIPAGVSLTSIAAGYTHTCALGSDGKAYCWGYNYFGQVGDSSTSSRYTPVAVSQGAVPAGVTFTRITAGYGYLTCALGSNGRGYCWGANDYYQVGDGSGINRTSPVVVSQGAIPAGVTLTDITAAMEHACALGSNGTGYCWGRNDSNQLGDGTGTVKTTPVAINQGAVPANVTLGSIASSYRHTCVLGSNGNNYCWGTNTSGEFGDATTTGTYRPTQTFQTVQFGNSSSGGESTGPTIFFY